MINNCLMPTFTVDSESSSFIDVLEVATCFVFSISRQTHATNNWILSLDFQRLR